MDDTTIKSSGIRADDSSDDQKAREALTTFQTAVAKYAAVKTITPEIESYLEAVITESKMPVYDEVIKKQIIRELFIRLDKFLSLKVAEKLTQESMDLFAKMVQDETKTPEDLNNFITSHVPNVDEILSNALVDFRDFYLTAQDNYDRVQQAGKL